MDFRIFHDFWISPQKQRVIICLHIVLKTIQIVTHDKKTYLDQISLRSEQNHGFQIFHGFQILLLNFRCRFANNFSCLLLKSQSFMMKNRMQTQNGHLTRSASPGLTPPAKPAQIQNGRLFNKDGQIFFRLKFTFLTSINHGKLYKILLTQIF